MTYSAVFPSKLNLFSVTSLTFIYTISLITAIILIAVQEKTWLIFGIPILPLAIYFFVKYPKPFFFTIIFFIPLISWRGLQEAIPALTVSKIIGIPIVATVILRQLIIEKSFNSIKSQFWTPFILFVLASIFSSLQSQWPFESLDHIRKLVQTGGFILISLYFIKSKKDLDSLIYVIIFSTTLTSIIAISGHTLHIKELLLNPEMSGIDGSRALGGASDPNFFAFMVVVALPLIYANFITTASSSYKILLVCLYTINFISIIMSYSRSMIVIATLTTIALFFSFVNHFSKKNLFFIFIISFSCFLIILPKIPDSKLFQRMLTLGKSTTDISLSRRQSYLAVGYQAFLKQPFFGYGLGNFKRIYSKSIYAPAFALNSIDFFREAHNTYLEVLTGDGILGFCIFLFIIIYALIKVYKINRKKIIPKLYALSFSLILCCLCLLTLSELYHKYLWLFLSIFFNNSLLQDILKNEIKEIN